MSAKSICRAAAAVATAASSPAAAASPPTLDARVTACATGQIGARTSWFSGMFYFTLTNVGGIACDADILLVGGCRVKAPRNSSLWI